MKLQAYNIVGFCPFLLLIVPFLFFLVFFILSDKKHMKKPERVESYGMVSRLFIIYIAIFFFVMLFGLKAWSIIIK